MGLRWVFDPITTMDDPGAGGIRFNAAGFDEISAIAISNACAAQDNPDVGLYVATWDTSTTIDDRGTLILQSETRSGMLAIFSIVGSTEHHPGWKRLIVRPVCASGSFDPREPADVAFYKTGNSVALAAPVSTEIALEAPVLRVIEDRINDQSRDINSLKSVLAALVIEARAA